MNETLKFVSIVIPAYNAAGSIGSCLGALKNQTYPKDMFEVIVVDDGSRDNTAGVAEKMGAEVLVQSNQGAGVARNLGAKEAKGEIILFTDSDCEPQEDWIEQMVKPFKDPEIVAAKGFYKTSQRESIARFAQIEYDIKCSMLKKDRYIDFIDTYSAAYRRDRFLEAGGFDGVYTTASGEDSELSYKLSIKGYKMVAVPDAFVYHLHPNNLYKYLKKKYRNAYWRVVTWKKYPSKIVKDSHTPNSYKFEVMLAPVLLLSIIVSFLWKPAMWTTGFFVLLFLVNEIGFLTQLHRFDSTLSPIAPFYLYLRGLAAASGAAVKIGDLLIKGKK